MFEFATISCFGKLITVLSMEKLEAFTLVFFVLTVRRCGQGCNFNKSSEGCQRFSAKIVATVVGQWS